MNLKSDSDLNIQGMLASNVSSLAKNITIACPRDV